MSKHTRQKGMSTSPNWPASLTVLIEVFQRHFEQSHPEMDACKEAQRLVHLMSTYLGGRQIYLPRGSKLQKALRNQRIHQAFNGSNQIQLAADFDLSVAQIYNILKSDIGLDHLSSG